MTSNSSPSQSDKSNLPPSSVNTTSHSSLLNSQNGARTFQNTSIRTQESSSSMSVRKPGVINFFTRPSSVLPTSSTISRSTADRKAEEAAKARKIREYLGIAAKISDVDFEALQHDIHLLNEALMEDSSEDQNNDLVDDSSKLNTPSSLVDLDSQLTENTKTLDEKYNINEEEMEIELPSDTESESEIDESKTNQSANPFLSQYKSQINNISWRWKWLQLQVNEVKKNVDFIDESLLTLQSSKEPCYEEYDNDTSTCSRINGWKKLSTPRKLIPPTARSLHLHTGGIHPLFATTPRKIKLPGEKKEELPLPDEINLSSSNNRKSRRSLSSSQKRVSNSQKKSSTVCPTKVINAALNKNS